jgi:tRNA(fMet)-specific endonuclease VapC
MTGYLLDTNICIFFLKNAYGVAEKIHSIKREHCFISEITLAELYYGAAKSGKKEIKIKAILALEKYFTVLPIKPIIEIYGDNKAELEKSGERIDDFDILIGSTAVANNLKMVSDNVKHLKRIKNIHLENWIVRK